MGDESCHVRTALVKGPRYETKDLDIFALASCPNLRQLDFKVVDFAGSLHSCSLPSIPCFKVMPTITGVRVTSGSRVGSMLNPNFLFSALAHMPHLQDLQISVTNFSTSYLPEVFIPVALKRYAFHHWGWTDGIPGYPAVGWSLFLGSSRSSLRELELTIQDDRDLTEWHGASANSCSPGAPFLRLRRLKLSMINHYQKLLAFARLLTEFPRVRDFQITIDRDHRDRLSTIGKLLHTLPNNTGLAHFAVGVRAWDDLDNAETLSQQYYLELEQDLVWLLEHSGLRSLKTLTLVLDPSNVGMYEFKLVASACRCRRVIFRVSAKMLTPWSM